MQTINLDLKPYNGDTFTQGLSQSTWQNLIDEVNLIVELFGYQVSQGGIPGLSSDPAYPTLTSLISEATTWMTLTKDTSDGVAAILTSLSDYATKQAIPCLDKLAKILPPYSQTTPSTVDLPSVVSILKELSSLLVSFNKYWTNTNVITYTNNLLTPIKAAIAIWDSGDSKYKDSEGIIPLPKLSYLTSLEDLLNTFLNVFGDIKSGYTNAINQVTTLENEKNSYLLKSDTASAISAWQSAASGLKTFAGQLDGVTPIGLP